MRIFAIGATALSLLSTQAIAYPVTYFFSGTVTSLQYDNGGPGSADPNTPLIIDGQQLTNGNPLVSGSFTFESEASRFNEPGRYEGYEGVSSREYILGLWNTIGYVLSAEGYEATVNHHASAGFESWHYSDAGFGSNYEGETGSPFFHTIANFNFLPAGAGHPVADYLLTENFSGGTFDMYGVHGCGSTFADPQVCWISGTIDSLTRVPEPGTLAIFGLGIAGLTLARRRRQH